MTEDIGETKMHGSEEYAESILGFSYKLNFIFFVTDMPGIYLWMDFL